MRTLLTAITLACLATACSTQPRGEGQDQAALPTPVNHKQRADDALTAFLASRSIREMPAYRDARADLDGDGTEDVLMLLEDANWCRAEGCTLLVFHGEKDRLKLVGESVSVRAPIAVGARVNHGWRDLLVSVGSGDEAGVVAMEFDGKAYPADPTMAALLDPTRLPSATPLLDAEMEPRVAAQ